MAKTKLLTLPTIKGAPAATLRLKEVAEPRAVHQITINATDVAGTILITLEQLRSTISELEQQVKTLLHEAAIT